jgi:CheY-like chemotaxis protein/HPt (histidine-containing phosphotransfer) domain-containing protein
MAEFPAKPTSPSGWPLLEGKHVLIAEDCRAQQRLLSYLLTKAGLSVTMTADGREAVERAGRESFDAILLDMQMPEIDGYEAAVLLRRQGYRGPILAITADNFAGDEARCLQAGCDGYLAKPMQSQELLGWLDGAVAETSAPVVQTSGVDQVNFEVLLSDFIRGLNERMRLMRAALVAEDSAALAQLAHKARGTAGMYGFPDLAETARLIEEAVRENQDRMLLKELLDELEALVQQISGR